MDPASNSDQSADYPHSRVAHLVGIIIALMTVTLPLCAIARFSSFTGSELTPVPGYTLTGDRK